MKLSDVVVHAVVVIFVVFLGVQQSYAQGDQEKEAPLFEPYLAVGSFLIFGCAVISSGAGLGGGGLFIPVFLLALGYNTHEAVPLSKSTILGVAYGGYVVNYSRRHPLVDRPLIDYDIALLLQPMILIGTVLGVSLNILLPDIIISILLVILLTTVSYRSIRKGMQQYREETAAMEAEKLEEIPDLHEGLLVSPVIAVGEDESSSETAMTDFADTASKISSTNYIIGSIQSGRKHKKLSVTTFDTMSHSQGGGRLSVLANKKIYSQSVDFEQYEDFSGDEGEEQGEDQEEGDTELNLLELSEAEAEKSANTDTYKSPRMKSFDIDTPTNSVNVNVGGGAIQNQALTTKHLPKDVEVKKMLKEEAKTPWGKFAALFAILVGLIALTIMKGGAGADSLIGVECGTGTYWVLVLLAIPYLGSFTFFFAKRRLRDAYRKEAIDYPYVEGDIRWDRRGVIVYPCFAVLAGTAAGCLGIGGGLVLGPLLLDIGVFPPVVTATSAFTIIFTATSVVSQFIVLGKLPFSHGAWYCAIGFVSAIIGHNFVKALVKKYKKNSMVSLVLGGAVGLSAVVLIGTSVLNLTKGHIDLTFNSLCDASAGE